MDTHNIILNDLKDRLTIQYGNAFCDVVLFGSQLKSGTTNDSDFDILIILDKKIQWKDEDSVYNLCYGLNLKYNIVIDIHLLSKTDINGIRGKQPIYVNALKSGMHA
jgi:predicted nucleotidyltransferase